MDETDQCYDLIIQIFRPRLAHFSILKSFRVWRNYVDKRVWMEEMNERALTSHRINLYYKYCRMWSLAYADSVRNQVQSEAASESDRQRVLRATLTKLAQYRHHRLAKHVIYARARQRFINEARRRTIDLLGRFALVLDSAQELSQAKRARDVARAALEAARRDPTRALDIIAEAGVKLDIADAFDECVIDTAAGDGYQPGPGVLDISALLAELQDR